MKERHGSKRGGGGHRPPASPVFLPPPPLVINGWKIYVWSGFRDRWTELWHRVEALRQADPTGYQSRKEAKFFAVVRALVLKEIPAEPSAPRFRQGKTMGRGHTHWRRAKFMRRFRLFFRYHAASKSIVYVWLNDENTLRKAGSSSDVYSVFAAMLATEKPPTDWTALVAACERWSGKAIEGAPPAL